jgi:hypothetical protein
MKALSKGFSILKKHKHKVFNGPDLDRDFDDELEDDASRDGKLMNASRENKLMHQTNNIQSGYMRHTDDSVSSELTTGIIKSPGLTAPALGAIKSLAQATLPPMTAKSVELLDRHGLGRMNLHKLHAVFQVGHILLV